MADSKSFACWTSIAAMQVCISCFGQSLCAKIDRPAGSPGHATGLHIQTGWGPEIKETTLSENTRLLVNKATADGHKEIPIIVASEPSGIDQTAALIRGLGGQTLKCIPAIGYIHAVLPAVALSTLARSPFTTDVAVAGTTMFSDELGTAQPRRVSVSNPMVQDDPWDNFSVASAAYASDLPILTGDILRKHPEMDPNRYMQIAGWRKEHPSADGRGVTVAVFDGVGDLAHPALQWALNGAGQRISKIAGIIDPVDHKTPNPANYFRQVDDDGEVHFSNSTDTSCPRPRENGLVVGTWMLHWYAQEKRLCFVWDQRRKILQIALPDETAFHSSHSITDFNHHASYVRFPVKRIFPNDESNRDITLFCIEDARTEQVFVHLGQDAHSTMVATAAAGTSILGTQITGVAPASRILYVEPGGYRMSEMIEGVWSAASRKDVDVIAITTGMDSYPDDPQPIIPLFLDRISLTSSKPVFVAAGNEGHYLEQNARGGRVINTVGAYEPGRMMQEFGYGHDALVDEIAGYSAAGPNMDGSWSTTILAPALGIAGWECGDTRPHPPSARVVGSHYRVPSCWATGEGTSVSTPRAAGIAALILSAAKMEHISISPADMRRALSNSALPLQNAPSCWQGAGRIQLTLAWSALMEEKNRGAYHFRSASPSISPLYPHLWRGPKLGATIYLTSKIHPNEPSAASLTLSSDRSLMGCHASLEHPDSSFEIEDARLSSKGDSLSLEVKIKPQSSGVLSETIEVYCGGHHFPVERLPITVAVTPLKD